MEVLGRIEPEVELHLFVTLPIGVHIGVKGVRISSKVPKELKVDLIVVQLLCWPL